MTRIGLRRHLRGALAAGLAGSAAALTAAAGLAETIAQELRLTMPEPTPDRDSGAPDEGSVDVGTATEVITPATEPPGVVEPSFIDESPLERDAFSEGQAPRAVPGDPVSVLDEEPLPEEELPPYGGTGPASGAAETGLPDIGLPDTVPPGTVLPETVLDDESSPIPPAPGAAEATADTPEPWAHDVAATVAEGTVREALERLPELTATQLRALERVERGNRGRVTLLRAIDAELALRG